MEKEMILLDILKSLPEGSVDEQREATDSYVEFVISNAYSDSLNSILCRHLGDALKKAGQNVTPEMKKITDDYGGIQKNQVLYYVCIGTDKVIAMLWPWQDKLRTTVKLIRIGDKT